MRKQAEAVMERLKISLPLDELVGSLPIATRQLVAICRALSAQARLVVMDEPTASLTHQEVDALLATIYGLKSHGIATVFVSHRLDEVMTIAETRHRLTGRQQCRHLSGPRHRPPPIERTHHRPGL